MEVVSIYPLNTVSPLWHRYADIYTSRVSNFLHYTPFMYFRAQEQVLKAYFFFYYYYLITSFLDQFVC